MKPDFAAGISAEFAVASQEEVSAASLERRFDRKYVLTEAQLELAVAAARGVYKLLPAGGQALAQYRTTYFDTPNLALFRQHARGQRPRYKVRIRHYPDRHLSFVEVKQKTNKNETIKHRLQIPYGQDVLQEEQQAFLLRTSPISPDTLVPIVSSQFTRLTLICPVLTERVTSDIHLTYESAKGVKHIERLAIVEVKQPNGSRSSPFLQALRAATVRPQPFSKYCVGVALAGFADRINAMMPTLKMIERLIHA